MMDTKRFTGLSPAGIAPGTPVAVTGATGFVGGRLVEMLARMGADVTSLIRGTDAGTRLHRAGARIRQIELSDADAVRGALTGISIVFHLAYDWGDTAWNFAAMRTLIEACRANKCDRLVFASSFVVYDIPDDGEVSESSKPAPATSGYPHTKLALEAELLQAVSQGLRATIIQPTIIYGPHSRPWTIDPADMLCHGTVILPQGGAGVCNAVYVDDVVSAMILAAVRPEAIGQRYLVSGGSTTTWNNFYESIASAIGAKGPQYRPADEISRSHGKLGKLRHLASDPNLVIQRVLRIGPVRKLARLLLRVLPHRLRQAVHDRWMVQTTKLRGHTHLPNSSHLHFLQGRASIKTTKAREELGYEPAFDFAKGMRPTARFLNEVYLKQGAGR